MNNKNSLLLKRGIHRRAVAWLFVTLFAFGLAGCFESAPTETLPQTGSQPAAYLGPPPATADVQAFKLNVWDNLVASNRCGSCHGAGGQVPTFVHQDDVNLAYAQANTVVDLASPADSRLVTKVGGGHNCWEASDAACAAVMTAYIEAWAGGAAGSSKQIELTAPFIKDAGASRNLPSDSGLFATTVHPLLTAHCAACHTDSVATPQSPYFASDDVDAAYEAARSKLDLDTPANSRLVVRLRGEFHNCWSGDCQADAQAMENAIAALAAQVPLTQVDQQLVTSKALTLSDGILASGGSRHEANVIALYEFKTGQGTTAYDTSGVEPAINLTFSGDVGWVGGYGIEIRSGKAQGSTAASKKLSDLIKATGEYSIEAWVVPANVTQEGPARIISYSAGTQARNFTLGQTLYNYDFLQRSTTTSANGEPALSTADADEVLQATQQHVVVTFDPANGRRIYVNGVFTGDPDPATAGSLADWDDTFAFILGNEASSDRLWQGKLRLVAIHNRALTAEQITQNFEAGVGEKFFLLFSIADVIGINHSYILFEVSQFDSYSYLFNRPTFIILDENAQPGSVPIQGLRIGINGKEASVGQAYRNLDVTVDSGTYTAAGQVLSTLGTIIGSEKGASADEFFLTFERLGSASNVVTEPAPLLPAAPPDSGPSPDIGLRTFEEINATMAAVTGVSATDSAVKTTYETIKQQLPTVENIEGFLSAHQVAVSQLAIEYCNTLVEDSALRADFFSGFNFTATADTAFDTTVKRDQVIDPLLANVMGSGLSTQPADADVKGELNDLIDRLTVCAGGCDTARTATVVKATCAATLGSAAMLLQ